MSQASRSMSRRDVEGHDFAACSTETNAPDAACDPMLHIARGGSWESIDSIELRPEFRHAGVGDDGHGFRCAK